MKRLMLSLLALVLIAASVHAQETTETPASLRTVIDTVPDPGLQAVYDAGLMATINQTQTIDGLSVTLLWAYADAVQINLGVRVTLATLDPMSVLIEPGEPLLVDEAGNVFQSSFYYAIEDPDDSMSQIFILAFDPSEVEDLPDTLNLTFVGSLSLRERTEPQSRRTAIMSEQPFSFDFTVPYQGGFRGSSEVSTEDRDIIFTVQAFAGTPSQTRLDYCLELPVSMGGLDYRWRADLEVLHDSEPVNIDMLSGAGGGGGAGGDTSETILQCVTIGAYVPLSDFSGEWTIRVTAIEGQRIGPYPEDVQAQFSQGVTLEDLRPELIERDFLRVVEGDWTVTFTLP